MSLALRDGSRPPRTAAKDPNLVTTGPRIENLQPIHNAPGRSAQFVFSPGGKRLVVYTFTPGKSAAFMIDPANPAEQTPVAQLDGLMSQVIAFDADVTRIVAVERVTDDPTRTRLDEPLRAWIIDRASGERTRVAGPWGEQISSTADEQMLSPDRRYLMISYFDHAAPTMKDGTPEIWHAYDIASGVATRVQLSERSAMLVGWTGGSGAKLRAVIQTGSDVGRRARQFVLVDPATGIVERSSVQPASVDPLVSSDRKLRMTLTPGVQLDVHNAATGRARTLKFHEDDRGFAKAEEAFTWLSPRYIRFDAQRTALIDAQTMKMSFLAGDEPSDGAGARGGDDTKPTYFSFSPGFEWAVTRKGEQLFIGRVIVPQ